MAQVNLKSQLLFILVGVAVLTPACDKVNKLDNMNDKTTEMAGTTKELLSTSKDLKTSTTDVVETSHDIKALTAGVAVKTETVVGLTSEIYDAQRQGGSKAIREEAKKSLRADHAGGDKLADAVTYFDAFEFQTFTGTGEDKAEGKMDLLLHDAMDEFFMTLTEFNSSLPDSSPFAMKVIEQSPTFYENSQTNNQACFDALAATLHFTNRKLKENITALNAKDKTELQPVSFYSLITATLMKEKDINSGKIPDSQVKSWEAIILVNRDVALKLLQARHNAAIGVFLNAVLPPPSFFLSGGIGIGEILPRWLGKRVMKVVDYSMKDWTLDLGKLNLKQLQKYQDYLQHASDTRTYLQTKLNIQPVINPTVQAYLNSAKLKGNSEDGAVMAAARTQFVGVFNQVKGGD